MSWFAALPLSWAGIKLPPMETSLSVVLITALTFLLAGFVKGVIGLGLPTVSMGLLALVMTPVQAAALLVAPSLVTNVWQMAAGPALMPLWRRLWPMMAGICAGTWAGAGLLTGENAAAATVALGISLVIYALTGLTAWRLTVPRSMEGWLSPAIGAITGFITAATGVFVIPAVPYLQGIGLEKEDLVQALGLSFTVSTLALAAMLMASHAFAPSVAGASLLALAPALVGMFAGQWLRLRARPEVFRRWFFIGLLLLGLHLSLHGLF
jgi:uncharacterized membrane protein YfcA